MNVTPRNPWVAKVHAHMLSDRMRATVRQIEEQFGAPPKNGRAARVLHNCVVSGLWFEVVGKMDGGVQENIYAAIPAVIRIKPVKAPVVRVRSAPSRVGSVRPRNDWTAKVHAYLLASKTQATSQQIVAMLGKPEGRQLAREHMANGVDGRWFEVVGQCDNILRENIYIALDKKSLRSPGAAPKKAPQIPKPAVRPAPKLPCYASIWDVAASSPAQIPPRSGPVISTRLSPHAQWVSA